MTSPPFTVLLLLALAEPAAHAEIFKCVRKDGLDLYQNFPCQFESLGWVPTNMQARKASTQPNSKTTPHAATLDRSGSPQGPTPPLGMTTEQVRAMWGEPTDSHWEEPGVGERSEVWSYDNGRSVRFVHGVVSAIGQ